MTQEQETPERVMGLLGVALTSMFFLFAVATTNANFSNVENPFPNPFSPDKIMASLDNVSNSYSNFVADMSTPMVQSLAILQDNVHYIIDNSDEQILAITGLSSLAAVPQDASFGSGHVAGASTQIVYSKYYPAPMSGTDSLFTLILGR